MTGYECLSLCIAVIAAGGMLLSWVRSGTAINVANQANQIAREALDHQKTTTTAKNAPVLNFEVNTTRQSEIRSTYQVEVLIHNGGQYATTIVEGQIALHSHDYPEAEKPHPLIGHQVIPGVPRRYRFQFKSALVRRSRPEIPATKLICEAIYERFGQEDGEAKQAYVFDERQDTFMPS